MKNGEFRHTIYADEPVTTQDQDTGEEVVDFVERGRMRCRIEPIDGREALQAEQIVADMDTLITVHWSTFASRITAKWRLRFSRSTGDIVYNIARPPAEKLMKMREIEFTCNSGANDG